MQSNVGGDDDLGDFKMCAERGERYNKYCLICGGVDRCCGDGVKMD